VVKLFLLKNLEKYWKIKGTDIRPMHTIAHNIKSCLTPLTFCDRSLQKNFDPKNKKKGKEEIKQLYFCKAIYRPRPIPCVQCVDSQFVKTTLTLYK